MTAASDQPDEAETRSPVTRASLGQDLADLGLTPGMTVMVHCSLSRLGWVAGGAQAVIEALTDRVGDAGTLVMPAQTGQLSDPADWSDPPVPEFWWPLLREALPAYDPHLTPSRNMGAVAELFRTLPGSRRSAHPLTSFAARGPLAEQLMEPHPPDSRFGESSPLARLHDAGAWVLLLGVDHGNSTALHLAEHRADFPGKRLEPVSAPVTVNGQRRWMTFQDLPPRSDDFAAIGEAFAASGGTFAASGGTFAASGGEGAGTGQERAGPVGWGQGRLCALPALVDFAIDWMESNR